MITATFLSQTSTTSSATFFPATVIAYADPVGNVTECFASEAIGTAEAPLRSVDINLTLSEANKERLSELLLEYHTCFARSSKIRQTAITKHRIITYNDVHPIRQEPYQVSPTERHAIQTQVKEMLQDGVIQPSSSLKSLPMVHGEKEDGTPRFCVDYTKLKYVTKKGVCPLPRVDDSLYKLWRAKYFSSVDLKSGYCQLEVDERDREKAAFVTPDGLYEFKVLTFGLCFAAATIQRMMDTIMADIKWKSCLVVLEDVFSETLDEHLRRLRNELEAIRSADLTLKLDN